MDARFQIRPARILYLCHQKKHLIFQGGRPLPAILSENLAAGRKLRLVRENRPLRPESAGTSAGRPAAAISPSGK